MSDSHYSIASAPEHDRPSATSLPSKGSPQLPVACAWRIRMDCWACVSGGREGAYHRRERCGALVQIGCRCRSKVHRIWSMLWHGLYSQALRMCTCSPLRADPYTEWARQVRSACDQQVYLRGCGAQWAARGGYPSRALACPCASTRAPNLRHSVASWRLFPISFCAL